MFGVLSNIYKRKYLLILLLLVTVPFYSYSQHKNKIFKKLFKRNDTINYLGYFSSCYNEARLKFKNKSDSLLKLYPDSWDTAIHVPSKTDDDLTVDILYIPPKADTERIIVMSSGVHGVEGYAGSAVQLFFMDNYLTDDFLNNSGILFIHSVNPFGFRHNRRVSENNVDINRNCTTDTSMFYIDNEGYKKIYKIINPEGKVNTGNCKHRCFFLRAVYHTIKVSLPVLRQAIVQGQYSYPKGLYFGGNKLEPQTEMLKPIIKKTCEPYNFVFAIDLHTGYGQRGKLHLFPNPVHGEKKERMKRIFKGFKIDWGDGDDFYIITGDFSDFVGQLNKEKLFVPMTFEYGTIDISNTKNSLRIFHNLVYENQGYHYGYESKKDSIRIRRKFLKTYYPGTKIWNKKILKKTAKLLNRILPQYYSEN